MAFVIEDEEGVGGYVVGAVDTTAFERRVEADWLPELRAKYPVSAGILDADRRYIALIHTAPRQDAAIVGDYPAHLHIDLLPRAQGRGLGRALIERFGADALAGGARGMHLGVSATNSRALTFYQHVRFETLRIDPSSLVLGRRLG